MLKTLRLLLKTVLQADCRSAPMPTFDQFVTRVTVADTRARTRKAQRYGTDGAHSNGDTVNCRQRGGNRFGGVARFEIRFSLATKFDWIPDSTGTPSTT